MKLPQFFIKHPVIAVVLNALIVVVGCLCLSEVPLREYPTVDVPVLTVDTHYPNADPFLIESSVTNVLEDLLAGVEGVDDVTSTSFQNRSHIKLTFQEGTNVDKALILVRDAVSLAKAQLPKEAFEPVVMRHLKSEGLPFMAVSLASSGMDGAALYHYAALTIKNNLRSIKGVASAEIWGQPYTMRVTLNMEKMKLFGVNALDIYQALSESNMAWPVGKYQDEIPASLDLRLNKPSDFQDLFLKSHQGTPIYLSHVADVALTKDAKGARCRINGVPGLMIGIERASDANPLEVSAGIKQAVDQMRQTLPADVQVGIELDQAEFVQASLASIKSAIFEAVICVLLVVFLFLRTARSTLIPLITIPISLIGAVIFLKICGFSINTLTLLAMVLAIGLVVDDAIVVLENIARHIEKGASPYDAAMKGSQEIGFAVIAMTLTLASVYIPIAFIQGAVGQLFAEFAVALAGSVVISGVVALTLSPMMCAAWLPRHEVRLWPVLDEKIAALEKGYACFLRIFLPHTRFILVGIGGLFVLITLLFRALPQETTPKEDRGLMGVFLPFIPGKTIDAMESLALKVEEKVKDIPEAQSLISFAGNWGSNVVLGLKPHEARSRTPAQIIEEIRGPMSAFPSADAWPWSVESGLPGVDGMNSENVSLAVSTTDDYRTLYDQASAARKAIEKSGLFESVSLDLDLDTPGYSVDVDQHDLRKTGLTPQQVAKTVAIFFSGDSSLTFAKDGIRYAVTLVGSPSPWTLDPLYITNSAGMPVSLGAVAQLVKTSQPRDLKHYNQMRTVTLSAKLLPDQHLADAMKQLSALSKEHFPESYRAQWVGAAKMMQKSSAQMLLLFMMALVFIYAILTLQFKNFKDPFIILVSVPLASFGALLFLWVFGQSMNVYTQIGLVTLVGLITKHGILIVEFANQQRCQGLPLAQAVIAAATQRLRPILMTTAAMLLGVLPLILQGGAGSEARHCMGIVLCGGLIFGTFFTVFIIPKVYIMIHQFFVLTKSNEDATLDKV